MNNINKLTVEPRKWTISTNWQNESKTERMFVTDMTGGLTEALSLGDWQWHWSHSDSPEMQLKPDTDYVFTFWLNGGENDRSDEVCQFRIYLNHDEDNPYIFKLNRDYIAATRYSKGWYRYAIPFNTGASDDKTVAATFQFCAMAAVCAVLPDKPEFADLPDEERPDPSIPQRHNIRFSGGYPRNTTGSPTVEKLARLGVDVESLLEHMDSEDLRELLRGQSMEKLASLGVDVESIIEHLDPEDKREVIREMMGL